MLTSLIFTAALPSVLPCISIGRMNRYRNTTARYKRQMRMAGLVSRNSSRNIRISAVMMAVVNRMMRLSKKNASALRSGDTLLPRSYAFSSIRLRETRK